MQNFLYYALFLLIVSGLLFAGCEGENEGVGDVSNTVDLALDLNEEGGLVIEETETETKTEAEVEEEEIPVVTPPAQTTTQTNPQSATESVAVEEAQVVEESSIYEDGTYSATGSYSSPAGPETVGVTLTVVDDVVTAVSIRNDGENDKTKNFQNLFASGISALVVGVSLDALTEFDAVNGSSLTPKGFQDAVEAIKMDA